MPSPNEAPGLTPDQLAFFHENGYLVIPNYLSQTEINTLLTETDNLLTNFDLSTHPLTTFTTGDDANDQTKHVGDDYFLTSGDKVRFFFEPDAFTQTPTSTNPTLTKPKHQSINKIGHSLHTLSAPFKETTLSARTAAIAKSLNFTDPRVLQSMVICKQPGIGGAVPPHRDSEFLYTDPPSAVGWWFALQDAGAGNASLGMWRGSHLGRRGGGIGRRFVRLAAGGTGFVGNEGAVVPRGDDVVDSVGEDDGGGDKDGGGPEVLDIPAGSLVLIHGNVLHNSEKNTGPRSRFAYTFHVIEGADGWVYDERNWLQPPENGGFSRLYA